MTPLLIILAAITILGPLLFLFVCLITAPHGYQDATGFHFASAPKPCEGAPSFPSVKYGDWSQFGRAPVCLRENYSPYPEYRGAFFRSHVLGRPSPGRVALTVRQCSRVNPNFPGFVNN